MSAIVDVADAPSSSTPDAPKLSDTPPEPTGEVRSIIGERVEPSEAPVREIPGGNRV